MYVVSCTYNGICILRCVSKASWDEALRDYPSFTKEERLKAFIGFKLKGGVPQPLREYCQAAIDSRKSANTTVYTSRSEGNTASFVQCTYKKINGQSLKENVATFKGAGLVLAKLPDVRYL